MLDALPCLQLRIDFGRGGSYRQKKLVIKSERRRSHRNTYQLLQPDQQESLCQTQFQQDYGVHGSADSECEWTPIVCQMGIESGGRIGIAGAQVRFGQSESALHGGLPQP